jgi:hypothetical protein
MMRIVFSFPPLQKPYQKRRIPPIRHLLVPPVSPIGGRTRQPSARPSAPHVPLNLDPFAGSRADRALAGTIAGGTPEIQRNIIGQQMVGLARG